MNHQANFDPQHAENFWSQWRASGCTLQQLFYLLLEPWVPGGGVSAVATEDVLDLTYQLAKLLPKAVQNEVMISRGIFNDPNNPQPDEIDRIMRLSLFISQYENVLRNSERQPRIYSKDLVNQIIDMTVDWPR